MKKITAIILAVLLAMSTLSGCYIKDALNALLESLAKETTEETTAYVTDEPTETEETETGTAETTAGPTGESSSETEPQKEPAEDFEAFLDELFVKMVSEYDTLSIYGLVKDPSAYGIEVGEPTLGHYYDDPEDTDTKDIEDALAELRTFDYASLTSQEQAEYDTLEYYFEAEIETNGLGLYDEPLSCYGGQQAMVPLNFAFAKIESEDFIETYFALLDDVPRYFESILEFEKKKIEAGLFMSDEQLEETIESIQSIIDGQEDSCLYSTFRTKIEALGLDDAAAERYINQNDDLVNNRVFYAYRTLLEELKKLKGSGKNDKGLAGLPQGKEYVEALAKLSVGTSKTPEEMINLIEEEMEAEMEDLQKLYLFYGATGENITYPTTDPQLCMRMLMTKCADDYEDLTEVAYSINYVDASLRDSVSPAMYYLSPVDAPNENDIYINADKGSEEENIFTTIAHEGYPGHMYYYYYSSKSGEHPIMRVIGMLGTAEGWAIASEYQSYSYIDGVDGNEAAAAAINMTLNLMIYARIDLGVNYEGWDDAKLQSYVSEWYDDSNGEASAWFKKQVISDPCGYLDYAIGYLEYRSICEEETATYGMDLKTFHSRFLDYADAPFDVIRKHINDTK